MQIVQDLRLPGATTVIEGPLDNSKFTNLSSLLNNAIPIILPIAGLILLAYLIWGGFELIFAAYWIVQLIAFIFKLETI